MKKMLLAAGIVALVVSVVGCKSAPTLQQVFEQGCAAVNVDLANLGNSPLLTADQQDDINKKIIPKNKEICAAGAQLNLTSLKTFHDSLLPIAIGIVQAVPTLPGQPGILLALQTFGPVVQQLIDQIIMTAAPASSASDAAAPVGASTVAAQ